MTFKDTLCQGTPFAASHPCHVMQLQPLNCSMHHASLAYPVNLFATRYPRSGWMFERSNVCIEFWVYIYTHIWIWRRYRPRDPAAKSRLRRVIVRRGCVVVYRRVSSGDGVTCQGCGGWLTHRWVITIPYEQPAQRQYVDFPGPPGHTGRPSPPPPTHNPPPHTTPAGGRPCKMYCNQRCRNACGPGPAGLHWETPINQPTNSIIRSPRPLTERGKQISTADPPRNSRILLLPQHSYFPLA